MKEIAATSKPVHFMNLDVLRFVAAMMVLIAHSYEGWVAWWGNPGFMTIGDYKTLSKFGEFLNYFIRNGGFGVDVFFLISGFLITYLMLVEKNKTGTISLGKFYLRRTFRIWPLYYFLVAITPLLVRWMHYPHPAYWPTILLYNNFYAIKTELWTFPFSHFWSICIEEHFYLIWPLIIWLAPYKKLPQIFFFVVFISIVSRGLFAYFGFGYYYQYLHTLSRMDMLAWGALGAWLHFDKPITLNFSRSTRLLVYILFVAIYSYEYYNIYDGVFLSCFRKYIYGGFAAFAMANYLFNPDAFFNFKKKNILHYFGKVSFGIYMYSNIVLPIIIEKIMVAHALTNMYLFFGLNILITIVISAISYETLERFFLNIKAKFEVIKTAR